MDSQQTGEGPLDAPATLDNSAVAQRFRQLGLMENPFAAYPDTRYFFPCAEHVTLYQKLQIGIVGNSQNRLSLVMGESGSAKTLLARRIANTTLGSPSEELNSVLIQGGVPTPTKLLIKINRQLNLDKLRSLDERLEVLRAFAENTSQAGKIILITLDSDINFKVYKKLKQILSWTDSTGFPLNIRAILFAQNNLFRYEERLKDSASMVGVRHTLGNLSYASATSLLEDRPRMAGRSAPLFNRDAISEIVEASQGHPGLMIQYAAESFMHLVRSTETMISLQMVQQVKGSLRT